MFSTEVTAKTDDSGSNTQLEEESTTLSINNNDPNEEGEGEEEGYNDNKESGDKDEIDRIEFEPGATLFEKVDTFVDTQPGRLHRLDIHLRSVDLLRACGRVNSKEGMNHARRILDRLLLEKRHQEQQKQALVIASKTFDTVLFGWAKLASNESPDRMKEILQLMDHEDQYDKSRSNYQEEGGKGGNRDRNKPRSSSQPTVNSYNTLLTCLAKLSRRDTSFAAAAERLLDEMMDHHVSRGWHTKPNTRSYTHAILAYANTQQYYEAGNKARGILERMKRLHEEEQNEYITTFGCEYDTENPENNVKRIITPDAHVYSAVISAYANSSGRNSAEGAYSVLLEMTDNGGIKLDAVPFISTIHAFANKASSKSNWKIRLEAAERAEEILWMLVEMIDDLRVAESDKEEEEKDEDDAEEEIDDNTDDADETNGDNRLKKQLTAAFNATINAWAKSDVKEAAARAENLLNKMLDSGGILVPDNITVNTVLLAYARQPDPVKAEELLGMLYELSLSGGLDESAKPDSQSYATVMNAWAKSKDVQKAHHARRLLETMLSKYEGGETDVKPNIVAFTTVLNAAGYSPKDLMNGEGYTRATTAEDDGAEEEEDGFSAVVEVTGGVHEIAVKTYEEVLADSFQLGLRPDGFFFASMLRAASSHTDPSSTERRHWVQRVFDDACHHGHVSAMVVRELRKACPDADLMARLLRSRKLVEWLESVDQLPNEWTMRVPKQPKHRLVDGRRKKQGDKRQKGRF